MEKFILEARINEYAPRYPNKHVPFSPDEIADTAVRVREEGACILHFHGRADDGSPDNSVARYREIIRAVRSRCDILILPTLGFISNDASGRNRINCVLELADDPATRPDIAPIDTGTANLDTFDPESKRFSDIERLYVNTTDSLIHYATSLRSAGVKPKLVSWAPGFTRRAVALADAGFVDDPLYILFHMTDGPYLTGHPGSIEGLQAHLPFLPKNHPHFWTANVLGGSVLKLADFIARAGGSMAIGIGDYAYPELGCPPNDVVVREAVKVIQAAGRSLATPNDARQLLGLRSP